MVLAGTSWVFASDQSVCGPQALQSSEANSSGLVEICGGLGATSLRVKDFQRFFGVFV